MKRHLPAMAVLALAGQFAMPHAWAQTGSTTQTDADSMRMVDMQGIEIVATRAGSKTPMAYTDIDRGVIEKTNNGVDLPFLLLNTPSVVATSEAGAGVGYTGIRIRGTDATRINVTANGIPMNDAESHGLFWVNTPDFAASLEDIQVQRGVGTSTNGAGAFGGSLNLKTQTLRSDAYGEVSGSYGSFNTHRESVNFGTGLLNGKWAFNARLSNIGTDGYRDRASVDLKSYFLQGGFYGKNTILKFITYGGKERTYHAWDGITKGQIDTIGRRYNPLGYIRTENGKDIYYKDQTDNYTQFNYQLHLTQKFSERLNLNISLHYTDGEGYYEQYKGSQTLVKYALSPFDIVNSEGNTVNVKKSDIIRRKMMDNWFAGGVFALNYNSDKLSATFGGAANKYDGDHYGRVIWVNQYAGNIPLTPDHRYYENKGEKFDMNFYLKANWQVFNDFYIYGDVQYRHINYKIKGINDGWDDEANNGAGGVINLDVDNDYDFFNPKVGILYEFCNNWSAYASFAMTHKEPTRNNFTDAEEGDIPKSERLMDYEAGLTYSSGIFSAGLNYYYMKYKDQLVLTGKVNHIGEALAVNMPNSYRTGIEIMAGVRPLNWLRWDVNATFSRNKVKGYSDQLYDWDNGQHIVTYLGTTTIAYSPGVLVGSLISARCKGLEVSLQSNYVGKQYVTNSESKWEYADGDTNDRFTLDAYFVNNLRFDYTFRVPSLKTITLGLAINNIFNEKYSSNGYGWVELEKGQRANKMFYFPQAGTNVLANLTFRF